MTHPQALHCHLRAVATEIEKIRNTTETLSKKEFLEDDIIHSATLHRLTTIGNLLHQISSELTTTDQNIAELTSFDYRTLLTSYWTVDLEEIYTLIAQTDELSRLQQHITTFIHANAPELIREP